MEEENWSPTPESDKLNQPKDRREIMTTLKVIGVSVFVLFSIFSWVRLYTSTVTTKDLVNAEPMVKIGRGTEEIPTSKAVQIIVDLIEQQNGQQANQPEAPKESLK